MKRLLASLLFAVSTAAYANSASTDLSDMWWNPNESGWGMNVAHQNDTLFITLYVYANNSAPTWYVAPQVDYVRPSSGGSGLVYSGALYATSGPWLGGAWNPSQFNYRQVGAITITTTAIDTATVSYSVEGVAVQKSVTRQTWRTNYIAGSYVGASIGTYSNCNPSSLNGYAEEAAIVTVTQGTNTATIQAVYSNTTCTYTGTYTQSGRMGAVAGTYLCNNGVAGTFRAFEVETSLSAFTARATANSNVCNWSGRIGGLRRGP